METKDKYKSTCKFFDVANCELTSYEVNNLKGIKAFEISGVRYLIKSIQKHVFKYALVVMDAVGRKYSVLVNSDSTKFLETCLITKKAVYKPYNTRDDVSFLKARN